MQGAAPLVPAAVAETTAPATSAHPSPITPSSAAADSPRHDGVDAAAQVAVSAIDLADSGDNNVRDEDEASGDGDEEEEEEEDVMDELDLYCRTGTIATVGAVPLYASPAMPRTPSPATAVTTQQPHQLQHHTAVNPVVMSRAVSSPTSASSSSLPASSHSAVKSHTRVGEQDSSPTDALEAVRLPPPPPNPYHRVHTSEERGPHEGGTPAPPAPLSNTARGVLTAMSTPPSQRVCLSPSPLSPPLRPLSPAPPQGSADSSRAAAPAAAAHEEGPYASPLMAEFDGELLDLIKAYYMRKRTATAVAVSAVAAAAGTGALHAALSSSTAISSPPPAAHATTEAPLPFVTYVGAAQASGTQRRDAYSARIGAERGLRQDGYSADSLRSPSLPSPLPPPLVYDALRSSSTTANEASAQAVSGRFGGPLSTPENGFVMESDDSGGVNAEPTWRVPADASPYCPSPREWPGVRVAWSGDAATSTNTTAITAASPSVAAALATAASSASFHRRLSSSMVPSFDAAAAAVLSLGHGGGAGGGSFAGNAPRLGLAGAAVAGRPTSSPVHHSPLHRNATALESRRQLSGMPQTQGPIGGGGGGGGGGALGSGIAQSLSSLSSLPTYSSTSFVRAYVSDMSLSLEPAILVSALTAALNIVVVYFLQQHVLDTRDHLGLFLIGSYMIFSSYYMIYYFLERFSASFRRIASQDKKFYIIGNLIKAGILISITPFACVHLVKIIVFDEWESNILRNLGCIYAIPDFISMVIVRRMRWSTWVHHACVVLFNYFSIMNNYQHENVCRCVVVYAAFSSFAYCVNVLLASRFLGVSAKVARVLSFVALTVYALCCAVNWAWQVYYLRRLLTRGHEHWTVYLYMLLISLVMWDDVVLNKWLLHHARNNAYAAAQHHHQRLRQQQQQQQQGPHQGPIQPASPHLATLSSRQSSSLAAALPPHLSPQASPRNWSQDARLYTAPATGLPPRAP